MVYRGWEIQYKPPGLCPQPRNQYSQIRVIISSGGLGGWPAGARTPHVGPSFSSPCRGGVSQGQVPGQGIGHRDPLLPRQQKVAHSGSPTVDLLSQAPQPYLRCESWKDVDSGSEGVCLPRAGLVLFYHLVRSIDLLSIDWVQTQMVGKTH